MLTLLLCAVLSGQERPSERWQERTGAALRVLEGALVRERDGQSVPLGCTASEGTGIVRDVAMDPGGLAFVAAERGLFVLGPFVEVLDPVEVLDGAPEGSPTSVFVDSNRRVWVATEDGIGVIEPSFFWGRTLAPEALPGDGPYRVEGEPGEGVRLFGSAGERVHRPAADPAPRLLSLRVDGQALDPGVTLTRGSGGSLHLEPHGEASGGASYRYRIDGHHVWQPFPAEGLLSMPSPGSHTIDVIAIDQDLDRSTPLSVSLKVAYPKQFDARYLLGAIVLLSALCLALFLARMRAASGRPQPWRALVSTGIVILFALQLFAGVEPHSKGWPFMGFNMYTRSFAENEIIYSEHLVMLRTNGTEFPVRPQSAGLMVDEPWEIMRPMIDNGEPALRAYLDTWRGRHGPSGVHGLQVQAQRWRLTSHGPVEIAPLVMAHFVEEPK